MILFLRNIPENTRVNDLYEFLTPALKRSFPFRSGTIVKAEILVLRDKHTKLLEYHGLVHVDSEASGERVIKKIKGKRFKNKLVVIREYKKRDWQNDRRRKQQPVPEYILNKRVHDRRRNNMLEIVQDPSTMFSASSKLSRKLI